MLSNDSTKTYCQKFDQKYQTEMNEFFKLEECTKGKELKQISLVNFFSGNKRSSISSIFQDKTKSDLLEMDKTGSKKELALNNPNLENALTTTKNRIQYLTPVSHLPKISKNFTFSQKDLLVVGKHILVEQENVYPDKFLNSTFKSTPSSQKHKGSLSIDLKNLETNEHSTTMKLNSIENDYRTSGYKFPFWDISSQESVEEIHSQDMKGSNSRMLLTTASTMASLMDFNKREASAPLFSVSLSKESLHTIDRSSSKIHKESLRAEPPLNSFQPRIQYGNLLKIQRSRLNSCSSEIWKSGSNSPYHTEKIEKGIELAEIAKSSTDSTLFKQANVKYKYEHPKQLKKKFKKETITKFANKNPYTEYLLTVKANDSDMKWPRSNLKS